MCAGRKTTAKNGGKEAFEFNTGRLFFATGPFPLCVPANMLSRPIHDGVLSTPFKEKEGFAASIFNFFGFII